MQHARNTLRNNRVSKARIVQILGRERALKLDQTRQSSFNNVWRNHYTFQERNKLEIHWRHKKWFQDRKENTRKTDKKKKESPNKVPSNRSIPIHNWRITVPQLKIMNHFLITLIVFDLKNEHKKEVNSSAVQEKTCSETLFQSQILHNKTPFSLLTRFLESSRFLDMNCPTALVHTLWMLKLVWDRDEWKT